jgi:Family of unknown function (DUF5681)
MPEPRISADHAEAKGAATRFQPGRSGNPKGRPKGSRNANTLALEALLDGEADALTRKAVGLALQGDIAALRLCLDRILAPRRDRLVSFKMGPIHNADDARAASAALLAAVAAGRVTPSEASEVGGLIGVYVNSFELSEVVKRLDKLEGGKP